MKEILNDKIYFQREYRLGKIKKEDWDRIAGCKHTFVINASEQQKYIQYPGFATDKKEIIKEYDKKIYFKFNFRSDLIIPPRGNLNSALSHVVCGIRPSNFLHHLSKISISWLIGPSSKMLYNLLSDVNVYPYFTNVYKNDTSNYGTIQELEFLINTFPNIQIIFLGSYKEYDDIIYYFSSKNKQIKYKKIWHPAYLVRAYSKDRYKKWVKSFIGE